MLIEKVFPAVVQERGNLYLRLLAEANKNGIDFWTAKMILSSIPRKLVTNECFFDKLTQMWRYEFGLPSRLKNTKQFLFGTDMWPPIDSFARCVFCAYGRLPSRKWNEYMHRLANPEKHLDALAEMMPILRIEKHIPLEFEVTGEGAGNKTIDWKIGPVGGRLILIDIKNRMSDLYSALDQDDIQPPQHDPSILFRSLESKFAAAAPEEQLQGTWIVTRLKQDKNKLLAAFNGLDNSKVHFAVFGSETDRAYILARNAEDHTLLENLFKIRPNSDFVYE